MCVDRQKSSSVSPADVDIPVELNLDSSRLTHTRLVLNQSSLQTAVHGGQATNNDREALNIANVDTV
ncbi:hypothetical protein M514_26003 [Trichuris suis]|uniref:Uncharacterized protein n=1 Tax=Trichuris suis TaxID=68888 RepID=A0A085MX55_9BILA|nr:hypothetical protein M514_26003 [Trichuris suis]